MGTAQFTNMEKVAEYMHACFDVNSGRQQRDFSVFSRKRYTVDSLQLFDHGSFRYHTTI